MKWFIFLFTIVGLYCFSLIKTTDMVLSQTQQLQHQYLTVAETADKVAAGVQYPTR